LLQIHQNFLDLIFYKIHLAKQQIHVFLVGQRENTLCLNRRRAFLYFWKNLLLNTLGSIAGLIYLNTLSSVLVGQHFCPMEDCQKHLHMHRKCIFQNRSVLAEAPHFHIYPTKKLKESQVRFKTFFKSFFKR
jgi:hypothetical protein